jgi:2-(1,2-epoxy-1,2-dihydrophenyl)acetyl-CoA isomerase
MSTAGKYSPIFVRVGEFSTERDGAIMVVTIDNQRVGNALSRDAAVAMADAFDDASNGSGDVRAILLRAEGKQFCTGADISGNKSGDKPVNGHMVRGLARSHHRLVDSVFHCRVPVVAAVQGAAMGAGLHLALAADFVIAAESARFKDPFTDRGFSVDSGGSWLLPRLIGLTRAKEFLYLGRQLDAATALAWGMVSEVVTDDALDATARTWVGDLAARPTQALAATKRLLHDSAGTTLSEAMHAETMAVELTLRSNDFKEGMTAFAERRPPEFTGT